MAFGQSSVSVYAVQASFMAHLSKRQRRETLSIVERAIAPEWKVLTYRGTGGTYTQSSNLAGQDIFSPIAQGVGESNRIGNTIRVRRIQFWVRIICPKVPQYKGSIPTAVCVYRRESGASSTPSTGYKDFFDESVLGASVEKYYYSTPRKRDLEDRGVHIVKIFRHRLFGCPILIKRATDLEANNLPIPSDRGLAATASGTLYNMAPAAVNTWVADPGSRFVDIPYPIESKEVGKFEVYKTWHQSYGGGGLKVGYADATTAVLDSNHQYIMFSSAVGDGQPADYCPSYEVAWRVWFTDD